MKKTLNMKLPKSKWVEFQEFCEENKITIMSSIFKDDFFSDGFFQCYVRLVESEKFDNDELVKTTVEDKEKLLIEKFGKYII